MIGVLIRREAHRGMQRGRGHVTMEAEAGVTWLQTKEC